MRHALLVFALSLVVSAQSQPPPPTPPKATQNDQSKAKRKQPVTSSNQGNADSISAAIDKLTAEIASWKKTQPAEQNEGDAPSGGWLKWSTITTALATLAIAGLGWLQWRAMQHQRLVMQTQADIMRGQLEAAHKTFASTRRPRLTIRYMAATDGVRTQRIHGTFDLFNVGETNATLRASYSEILAMDRLPAIAPYEGEHGRSFIDTTLIPGKSVRVAFPTTERDLTLSEWEVIGHRTETAAHSNLNLGRTGDLYVIGWVEYADDAGEIRMMGFCRKYNFLTDRFERYSDPDYEYDDYG